MNDFSENWRKLRLRAGSKAELLGNDWPNRKDEAYHYHSLSGLGKIDWQKASQPKSAWLEEKISTLSLPETENRIVFANGYFSESLSFLAEGVSWKEDISETGKESEALPFEERLNEALRDKKFILKMPKASEKQSLQLLFINDGNHISCHSAIHLHIAKSQRLSVFEAHLGDGAFLDNHVVTSDCAEGSSLVWTKAQFASAESFSLSLSRFLLQKEASVNFSLLAKGSVLAREVVQGRLLDENAHLDVNGLQLVDAETLADFNIAIAHEANYTFSDQVLKTLSNGNGHAIFQGKSAITKKGNKSEAHQKSDALLLSDQASFDVKPELEIFADDVKCSHGATIGALEEQDIFYLRARGISLEEAKRLLLFSFINDILDRIVDEDVRSWAQAYVFPFLDAKRLHDDENSTSQKEGIS